MVVTIGPNFSGQQKFVAILDKLQWLVVVRHLSRQLNLLSGFCNLDLLDFLVLLIYRNRVTFDEAAHEAFFGLEHFNGAGTFSEKRLFEQDLVVVRVDHRGAVVGLHKQVRTEVSQLVRFFLAAGELLLPLNSLSF